MRQFVVVYHIAMHAFLATWPSCCV